MNLLHILFLSYHLAIYHHHQDCSQVVNCYAEIHQNDIHILTKRPKRSKNYFLVSLQQIQSSLNRVSCLNMNRELHWRTSAWRIRKTFLTHPPDPCVLVMLQDLRTSTTTQSPNEKKVIATLSICPIPLEVDFIVMTLTYTLKHPHAAGVLIAEDGQRPRCGVG